MAMLDVDGSSLPTDSQPKLNGLVWGLVLSLYSSNEPGELSQWLWAILLLAHLQLCAEGGLIKCSCSFFSLVNDSVRPLISTSTGPIFTQYAGTPELSIVEDERPEVIFRFLKERCRGNQFCGQNRPPVHTFDLSSRAFREISVYGEKCNHRPVNKSVL